MIEPKPCACGSAEIHLIHARNSGRVFALCPYCFRKTKIYSNESKAREAWNSGKVIESK